MKNILTFAYRVALNYNYFLFDNGKDALEFAIQAFSHQVEGKDEDYNVRIDLIPVTELEEPEGGLLR